MDKPGQFPTTNELELYVPEEKQVRLDIRNKVDCYYSQHSVLPPISLEQLRSTAATLLAENEWEPRCQAFVMICCGNAVWRSIVETVPYDRRLLLLPQCLKNHQLCQGQQDEWGLLCSECGHCSISGFLREAENLGYVAIVAEGTTITTRLIESGKVDAVVGVSCMEVLQKMFVSVAKYSIPSIGIPLLTNGCKDTLADTDWIKKEIYHYKNNPAYRLLNLNYLRNRTYAIFGEEQLSRILKPAENAAEQLARESLLAGGKRLRPLLTVLTFEAFSNQPEVEDLNRLALSVECFHKASLIHDDIEDGDIVRYGKETLHARYGTPLAINIGDLLIGEGYRLLAETRFRPEIVRDCIAMVAQGHRALSIGQGMELMALRNHEILSLEDILQVFEYKTATAFKVSLLLGAIAGNADPASLAFLHQVSRSVGIAYQIKDDLEECNAEAELKPEKPSVLISWLYEHSTPSAKNLLREAYRNNAFDMIQRQIEQNQTRSSVTELLKRYVAQAKKNLGNCPNIGLKLALHEILGKTFKEYI